MRDKIAGALYGVALGDTMGMPAELRGKERVKVFPRWIEGPLGGPVENDVAFNYKKDQFIDNTDQTPVLLDSIESTDYESDTRDIVLRMLARAEKENVFENNILGPTSRVALTSFRDSIQDSRITDKALSNGGTMRIAPIGYLFRPEQEEDTVRYAYLVSGATHTSDAIITGAAMTVEVVNSVIVKDGFEKVMEDVFGTEEIGYGMGCEAFSLRLGERLRIGLDIAGPCKGDDEGFTHRLYDVMGTGVGIVESVPTTPSVARYAQDPNPPCLLCTNMAGDADTIGATATTVCGAPIRMGRIKSEYVQTLRQQNDADFDHYIRILKEGRERFTRRPL